MESNVYFALVFFFFSLAIGSTIVLILVVNFKGIYAKYANLIIDYIVKKVGRNGGEANGK